MSTVATEERTVLAISDQHGVPGFLVELARSGRYRSAGGVVPWAEASAAVQEQAPDVVVAEVRTHGQADQLANWTTADRNVVVVSAVPAESVLLTCFAGGARGFVLLPAEPGFLDQAVAAVAGGRMFVDPRCTAWLVDLVVGGRRARTGHGLTLRQREVVQLAREGLTNRQIAQALRLSTETVKWHLQEAMRRLGAHDRFDAAERADGERDQ